MSAAGWERLPFWRIFFLHSPVGLCIMMESNHADTSSPCSAGDTGPKGGDSMKKYELMFIVNVADEAVIRSAVELVRNTIAKIGGTIDKEDEWGKRQLAYEVKHQTEGYYVVVDFQADPAEIKELDRVIKIHEEIIRHIIVKLDD